MWPFSKKPKEMARPGVLPFKSGEAFFEMQCKYGETTLQPKKGVVALVVDASKMFGTRDPVAIEADGRQRAVLRVASDDGGFIVSAETPKGGGDRLKPGDVVIWVPWEYNEELGSKFDDRRFGWIGFIVAKVKPEMDTTKPGFDFVCRY